MATAPKEKKQSLPQLQIGVRETSNIRMILLAAPRCPVVSDPNSDKYTGEVNCQVETANAVGWWNTCENRGHDPYFSTTKRARKVPVFSTVEGEEDIITGYREKVTTTRTLNTVRVPLGTRYNSGRAVQQSIARKGRKTLTEMGYNEKCEFRNCELDATFRSKYGNFCGDRHARLIGADVEGIALAVPEKRSEREKDLRGIDVTYEGVTHLQVPPDTAQ